MTILLFSPTHGFSTYTHRARQRVESSQFQNHFRITADMESLPPELVHPILETCIIDDVFNLRLVSRSFLAWIDYYLSTVAYQIARNTFPKARLILRPTHEGVYDLAWLRTLVPRRLASIVLDKDARRPDDPTNTMRYRIPSEDGSGDLLRKRVSGAWCLIKRIGTIYKDVYALPLDAGASLSDREEMVYERVLFMIKSLEPHECEAFFILAYVLLSAFHDENCRLRRWRYYLENSQYKASDGFCFFDCRARHPPSPKSELGAESTGEVSDHPRHPDHGNSWIWSWIFREGADAFWKQWGLGALRLEPENYVALKLQDAWSQRSEAQVHIERETSARIWCALMERSKARDPQSLTSPSYNSLMNPSNDIFVNMLSYVYFKREQGIPKMNTDLHEWYLWQDGKISIDETLSNLTLTEGRGRETRRYYSSPDSIPDVPYIVSFKTFHT
ncbi:hypothetical protein F4810DRAFT_691842 [Camillea tinctor]|nr:hypothetical protein F4810DRAFT_691842 [Camillea tinctor]